MKKELKKQEITIEVIPELAVTTIGLLKGILPSIIEQLERQGKEASGESIKLFNVDDMQEVLGEIYEKCIAKTNIREHAAQWIEKMVEESLEKGEA